MFELCSEFLLHGSVFLWIDGIRTGWSCLCRIPSARSLLVPHHSFVADAGLAGHVKHLSSQIAPARLAAVRIWARTSRAGDARHRLTIKHDILPRTRADIHGITEPAPETSQSRRHPHARARLACPVVCAPEHLLVGTDAGAQ